jgi:hypothetical protein
MIPCTIELEPRGRSFRVKRRTPSARRSAFFRCRTRASRKITHAGSRELTRHAAADFSLRAHTEPNSRGWELLVRDLRKLGKKHSVIRDALDEALFAAPKAIKLVLKSKRRLRVDEASSVVTRNQLRVARKLYGPKLDHERIELRVIADAHGNDRFDVLQYGDAGAIFRAGTNDLIGGVMQGGFVFGHAGRTAAPRDSGRRVQKVIATHACVVSARTA